MIKRFSAFAVVIGLAIGAVFQATNVHTSGTLPTNCTVGNVYLKTGTSAGFYVCLATDVWTGPLVSSGSGTLVIPSQFVFNAAICQDTASFIGFSSFAAATAPTADCVSGANVKFGVAGFDDDGAERQIQGHFRLPSDWTGAVDLVGKWRSADTSGSVVWQVATICVADAETSDPSFNAAQAIVDAAKGTTLQQNDFSQTGVTMTGCAANEELYFKFFRDSDHASDDLATSVDGIAQLIQLTFTVRRLM